MVHQYKLNGFNIVMDMASGAVHAVDEVAYDIIALYPDHALYPFMLDGAIPLNDTVRNHAPLYALVFGNEQTGLPARFAQLGQSVLIPQSKEIDSLNLAVAVSIGTYVFTTTIL